LRPWEFVNSKGEQVSVTGKVKFFNEAKGWIIEGAVKWAVSYLLSHTH
jgi:hypothetical protein